MPERSAGQLLLDLLGDRPVAYHPQLARAFDSVPVAVFLGQLLYWTGREADPEGWIWKSRADWTAETALSRHEQDSARRALRELGILEEHQRGYDRTLGYRVNQEKFLEVLAIAPNRQMELPERGNASAETGQCMCRKPAIHDHRLPSEITSQTTAEIPPRKSRRKRAPPPPGDPPRDADALRDLFTALARVCRIDPKVKRNRGKLNRACGELYDAGRRADDVQAFWVWWQLSDWRWKKNQQRPTLDQVLEGIDRPAAGGEACGTETINWDNYKTGEYAHLFADDDDEEEPDERE